MMLLSVAFSLREILFCYYFWKLERQTFLNYRLITIPFCAQSCCKIVITKRRVYLLNAAVKSVSPCWSFLEVNKQALHNESELTEKKQIIACLCLSLIDPWVSSNSCCKTLDNTFDAIGIYLIFAINLDYLAEMFL